MDLWIIAALLSKHFIADFILQPRWMYSNKGTFGHPGGIAHAGLHGFMTWWILAIGTNALIPMVNLLILCVAEMVIHYAVDWSKMNLNAKMGWGPNTSEKFWWLLGLDQWLHHATYVWLTWMVTP